MCQQHDHRHEMFLVEVLFEFDDPHDFYRIDRVAHLIEQATEGYGRCPDCLSTESLIPSYETRTWVYNVEHDSSCPRAAQIEQEQNDAQS